MYIYNIWVNSIHFGIVRAVCLLGDILYCIYALKCLTHYVGGGAMVVVLNPNFNHSPRGEVECSVDDMFVDPS